MLGNKDVDYEFLLVAIINQVSKCLRWVVCTLKKHLAFEMNSEQLGFYAQLQEVKACNVAREKM